MKAGLADGETSKKKRQKKVFTFNYDDDSLISGIEKLGKVSVGFLQQSEHINLIYTNNLFTVGNEI